MAWKIVRKWIPGRYIIRNRKRVHIRGHYRKVKIWVPTVIPIKPKKKKAARRRRSFWDTW